MNRDIVVRLPARRRQEVEAFIRSLPGILAGTVADQSDVAKGFRLRLAFMFFSLVKEAFIVKSRGGTDECGITWPPLSAAYLAYVRPMGRGGVGSRMPPRAGGLAPGGDDGFMTAKQLQQWRAIYARISATLILAGTDPAEARGTAAMVAWSHAKKHGVRTKLQVFGSRTDVEILRDRGILFNSLSPGYLVEGDVGAEYQPPADQLVDDADGNLTVGTNVVYAGKHHNGRRPFWPRDGNLPDEWWEDLIEVAMTGLLKIWMLFRD